MNTVQLECFITVAEHLNFSRASEILRITQPAVSHQIRTLEGELGVKLFRRTSKSVALTTEGIQFLPDAELILKTAYSARSRLGSHEDFLPFDIGCHNHMELQILPSVLERLAGEFPRLRPSTHMIPFPSLLGGGPEDPHGVRHKRRAEKILTCIQRTLFCSCFLYLRSGTSAGTV